MLFVSRSEVVDKLHLVILASFFLLLLIFFSNCCHTAVKMVFYFVLIRIVHEGVTEWYFFFHD